MNDAGLARKYLSKIQSAKERGLEFSISFAYYKRLMKRKSCSYTGIRFSDSPPLKRTLDRLDSNKGYVPGNVFAVCHMVNSLKGTVENPANVFTDDIAQRMFLNIQELKEN